LDHEISIGSLDGCKTSQPLQSMLPTTPVFAQIRHTKPVVEASNVLPHHIIRSDAIVPHTIVTLFFTETLLKDMTKNTNL
jgi:hypothetical protein